MKPIISRTCAKGTFKTPRPVHPVQNELQEKETCDQRMTKVGAAESLCGHHD